MPADRRALRKHLVARRDSGLGGRKLIGFDFDCTLTVCHFYKVFAWGYAQANPQAHEHCKAFFEWCDERELITSLRITSLREVKDFNDPMGAALEDFNKRYGEQAFKEVFREVFLGGSQRIGEVAARLETLSREGVEMAIVTAGTSTAVLRALTAVPEWQPFFPASHVWDTSQGRHNVRSVIDTKLLILRDICPSARKMLLVDDSLSREKPTPWVLSAAGAEVYEGLKYEGTGLDEAHLQEIEQRMLD